MSDPNNDNGSDSDDSGGYQMMPNAMTDFSQSSDDDSDDDSYSSHFLLMHEQHHDVIEECIALHNRLKDQDDWDPYIPPTIFDLTWKILRLPFGDMYQADKHIQRPLQNEFEPMFDEIFQILNERDINDYQEYKRIIKEFYWCYFLVIDPMYYDENRNMTSLEYKELWNGYLD
jgi:hypothetical protein